jgi:hypothetical protein
MTHQRHASVLLVAIGITAVCLSIAFAFLATVQRSLPGAGQESLNLLARSAARAGANHAFANLLEGYSRASRAATQPAAPTHYGQPALAGFGPIDTHKSGWWDAAGATDADRNNDNYPLGAENTPEDMNGNDVPANDALPEGSLTDRTQRLAPHLRGHIRTHPSGRWIEPGYYFKDLVGKPVSFHLSYPAAAVPGSTDPAARIGQAYGPASPDVNQPLYYDNDLNLVTTRSEARYRLRYAVAIEDLAGHTRLNAPGEYIPPTTGAHRTTLAGGMPRADARGAIELDASVIDDWYDNLAAMLRARFYGEQTAALLGLFSGNGIGGTDDARFQFFPIGSGGMSGQYGSQDHWPVGRFDVVADPTYPPGLLHTPFGIPAQTNAPYTTNLHNYHDAATTAAIPTTKWLVVSHRGPALDAEWYNKTYSTDDEYQMAWSPYGRGSRQAATPSRWDEAQTACPWRYNAPTLSAQAVFEMTYGFMPPEFFTNMLVNATAAGAHWSNLTSGKHWTTSRLRDNARTSALWTGRLPNAGTVYPGMALTTVVANQAALPDVAQHWHNQLGEGIRGRMSAFYRGGMPLHGWTMYDFQKLNNASGHYNLSTTTDPLPTDASYTGPRTGRSWWWMVHTGLRETMWSAMYVWSQRSGYGHSGAPLRDRIVWPGGHFLKDDGTVELASNWVLDHDSDGDGQPDLPSLLDEVEELDRVFILNMGEWWQPSVPDPLALAPGLFVEAKDDADTFTDSETGSPRPRAFVASNDARMAAAPSYNLLARRNLPSTHASHLTVEQARYLELVLNDTRLSFFGSSPQYPHFTPIDFDGDGTVWCIGYPAGNQPAAGRYGPTLQAAGGQHVCLTGYLVFQPSRFFHCMIRGEVFDVVRNRPVARVGLESIVTIDPDGSLYDVFNLPTAAWNSNPLLCQGLEDSQILHQRWTRGMNPNLLPALTP